MSRLMIGWTFFMLGLARSVVAADALQVQVTEQGLHSLKYQGVEYCDPSGAGGLGFSSAAAGVQDTKKSREPFPSQPTGATVKDSTVTLTYPWGALTVTYSVIGADLDIRATLTNTSAQAIGWWGANLLQLNQRLVFDASGKNMHWDYSSSRFGGGGNPYLHWNFADPHVYWWNDGGTKIVFADLDPKWGTGVLRLKTEDGDRWAVVGTANGDAGNTNAVIAPGGSDSAHVALRFRPVTDSALTVAADSYGAWGRAYPLQIQWTDRRPLGMFFVAESAKGWSNNPNGWFNDPQLDVLSDTGRQKFADRLLRRVDDAIKVLQDVNAQGVIWWDVEGARNPHPITYIGDPRVLNPQHPDHDKYAPEMDTPVTFGGKTLPVVDACFAKFRAAGLQVGLTIRPQALTWTGSATVQKSTNNPADVLLPKVDYARERWGCRIFYVDSVADWFVGWWFEPVIKKHPDILLMPEWARTRTFVNSAPFSYTKFSGWYRGTPPEVKACWPNAFIGVSNLDLNDAGNRENAVHAIQQGDLIMFNCWYGGAEAQRIKAMYEITGAKHTPLAQDGMEQALAGAPTRITLHATDEDKEEVRFSLLEPPQHGSLEKLDPKTGTVTYRASAGFIGRDSFTFKATAPSGLDSNRGTVQIHVTADGKLNLQDATLDELLK